MLSEPVRKAIKLFSKGLAMGAADSVPGVSGGTIAVISGIYDELILSLRAFDLQAVRLLLGGQFARAWSHVNGSFLLILLSGIVISLRLSAGVVLFLLDNHFETLMAFFIGLVLASSWYLRAKFGVMRGLHWLALLVGMGVTLAVGSITPQAPLDVSLGYLFLCGMVAICAMILPGISGAFILLMLGVYDYLLTALLELVWEVVLVFIGGCALGLLSFSHLLGWALARHRDTSYAFLTGMLIGSVYVLWPWQTVQSFYTDSYGGIHPLQSLKLWPTDYLAVTGQDPLWMPVLAALVAGAGLIIAFEYYFSRTVDVSLKGTD
ncbi:MAG: hypothetical protein RLZZ385_642 [Pseudomonadota bacterium]|jgi:putative membrane protein